MSEEYKPFKCPDCSVWWRTATHKCEQAVAKVTVTKPSPYSPYKGDNWIYCPKCGKSVTKYDWHTCKHISNEYNKKRKQPPHDPEIDNPRWHA